MEKCPFYKLKHTQQLLFHFAVVMHACLPNTHTHMQRVFLEFSVRLYAIKLYIKLAIYTTIPLMANLHYILALAWTFAERDYRFPLAGP